MGDTGKGWTGGRMKEGVGEDREREGLRGGGGKRHALLYLKQAMTQWTNKLYQKTLHPCRIKG